MNSVREHLWSSFAAARLTWLLLVRRKKILFLGVLAILPALLPIIVAALRGPGLPGTYGLELYAGVAEYGFLGTLVPLGAILLGTALMGDDLETGTATYLLTRPGPRSAIVIGKFVAYSAVMIGVFLPALGLTFASVALTTPMGIEAGPGAALLLRTAGVVCLATFAYGALCLLLGTFLQRPVIASAIFVFGWEPLTRVVPGYVDFLTLKKHLLALWPSVVLSDRRGGLEISRRVIEVGVGEALIVIAVSVVVFMALATVTLRRKEFVRGQTMG